MIDFDYTDKLNDTDKKWLSDFSMEYYNANFKKRRDEGKESIIPEKDRKETLKQNNRRNFDIFGRNRAGGMLNYSPDNTTLDNALMQTGPMEQKDQIENDIILRIELNRLMDELFDGNKGTED